MNELLRRWLRELRAIGAHPAMGSLEELLRAPSFSEQAVHYARERHAQGVHMADVVRELGALARVLNGERPLEDVVEGMARVAGDAPPEMPWPGALQLLDQGLALLDENGNLRLQTGPQPQRPELAERALSTGRAQPPRVVRDAEERVWECEARPLIEEGRVRGAVEVFRDRTELERLSRELQRADRELTSLRARLESAAHLQALGDVAAGAALTLNNELNAIALTLPLLRVDSERGKRLDTVESAVGRAAAVVGRLQQLAAPRRSAPPRTLDANQAVLEALDLVRPELTGPSVGKERRLRVDAKLGEVPPALAQPALLRELLCSLLVQARDALPSGGVLTIRTRAHGEAVEIELRHAAHEGVEPLSDLALAGARELARASTIELDTWRDRSERVLVVRLPRAASAAAPPPTRRPRARRVLVVDDDADNRDSLCELLVMLGHETKAVGDSGQALEAIGSGAFDAALIDLAMPDMNGWELARRIRQIRPAVRMALVTGWEEVATPETGLVEAVFRKPVDVPAIERFLGDAAQPEAS